VQVTTRLIGRTALGVDQHDGDVSGRGAGDHVARVLHVPRRIGEDEAPSRRREVTPGDVDRDALLALGAQAVGHQGQLGAREAAPSTGLLDVIELVDQECLTVEEQSADERRLPVIDGTGGGDTDHGGGHQK